MLVLCWFCIGFALVLCWFYLSQWSKVCERGLLTGPNNRRTESSGECSRQYLGIVCSLASATATEDWKNHEIRTYYFHRLSRFSCSYVMFLPAPMNNRLVGRSIDPARGNPIQRAVIRSRESRVLPDVPSTRASEHSQSSVTGGSIIPTWMWTSIVEQLNWLYHEQWRGPPAELQSHIMRLPSLPCYSRWKCCDLSQMACLDRVIRRPKTRR